VPSEHPGLDRDRADDSERAHRLLDLVTDLPTPVWGRDELDTGEMWNSNSVTASLVARSGLDAESIHPPARRRAPGWEAGCIVAKREAAQDLDLRRSRSLISLADSRWLAT
jgi:hypothetical protein